MYSYHTWVSLSPLLPLFSTLGAQYEDRLEKAGFRLETQAEQSASLTSALSDYTYDATATSKSKNNKKSSSTLKKKKAIQK